MYFLYCFPYNLLSPLDVTHLRNGYPLHEAAGSAEQTVVSHGVAWCCMHARRRRSREHTRGGDAFRTVSARRVLCLASADGGYDGRRGGAVWAKTGGPMLAVVGYFAKVKEVN